MAASNILGIVSCDKNDNGSSPNPTLNEKIGDLLQRRHINVTLNQQNLRGDSTVWLHFHTKEDYFETLELLADATEDDLEDFENAMFFSSMRKLMSEEARDSIGIDDDVLAALLNINGKIQIGDSLYIIDIPDNKVTISNLINNINTDVSLDYEVFNEDYVNNNNPLDKSITDDDDDDDDEILSASYYLPSDIDNTTNVKCKVKYCRAVIFFSLKAVMREHHFISGFYSNKNMHVFSGTYTQNKNGATPVTFSEYSIGGDDRTYKHVVYRRAKGLKKFNLTTDFTVYHYNNGGNHSNVRLGIHR